MAEYLVVTQNNSYYLVEGTGRNLTISSQGEHSSLKSLTRAKLTVGARLLQEGKREFSEKELMGIVGHSLFFVSGMGSGQTSRIAAVYKKIS